MFDLGVDLRLLGDQSDFFVLVVHLGRSYGGCLTFILDTGVLVLTVVLLGRKKRGSLVEAT